jgi:hypothetical protein
MSIVFRIATAADDRDGPTATINARQLAAFRSLLRAEGSRLRLALIDPDDDEETPLAYSFEARVCPLALASMARVFDFAADVIAVLDEAQFRSRRVSFYRSRPDGPVAMRPSITSDLGVEMDLASGNAYALLESLGLRPDSVGELPVAEVRKRLDNPAVRRRMREQNIDDYAESLERLIATADTDDSSRFEWA